MKITAKPFNFMDKNIISRYLHFTWSQWKYAMVMVIIPLLSVVIIPACFLLAVAAVKDSEVSSEFLMASAYPGLSHNQVIYSVFIHYVSPILSALSAIVAGGFASLSIFVREKTYNIDTALRLTPTSSDVIFSSKCIAAGMNTLVVVLAGEMLLLITTIVGALLMKISSLVTFSFILNCILICPLISLCALLSTTLLSHSAKNEIHAASSMGYTGLVFVLFYLGSFIGIYKISAGMLFVVSLLVIIINIILYFVSRKVYRFER